MPADLSPAIGISMLSKHIPDFEVLRPDIRLVEIYPARDVRARRSDRSTAVETMGDHRRSVARQVEGWQSSAGAVTFAKEFVRSPGLTPQMLEEQGKTADSSTSARWAALMTSAQAGDKQAYARILKEIAPFIQALVRRFHANPETVEDVVQDTLLTIHRVRHTYEEGRSVHAWVAAIARRRAIDTLRTTRKHRVGAESIDLHDRADDRANHGDTFAHREQIVAALQTLPPSQREAVRLLKVEEYSLEEASRLSGQSVLALKSLVYRAVKTLRERMAGGQDG